MSNDIYKAPEADLSSDNAKESSSEFFIVSIRKLWIMNVITMGAYIFIWNYKNWKEHRTYINNFDIWPVPRSIFSIFYISSLLDSIADSYEEKTNKQWKPLPYVVAYIVMGLLGYALNLIPDEKAILVLVAIIAHSVLITYLLSHIQLKANEVCDDIKGEKNKRITAWNIFWIVIFSITWLLMLFGTYIIFMGDV